MNFSSLFLTSLAFGLASAGINSISYRGVGCSPGTFNELAPSNDFQRNITFQDFRFSAQFENGSSCQLDVNLTVPSNWSEITMKFTYSGYAKSSSLTSFVLDGTEKQLRLDGDITVNFTRSEFLMVERIAGPQVFRLGASMFATGRPKSGDGGEITSYDIALLNQFYIQ